MHSAAAGVGNVLKSGIADTDILLTNSAGIHAIPMAEFVVGRRAALPARAGRRHRRSSGAASGARRSSSPTTRPLRELGDCRVLIVGTGGIGQATAVRLAAFGATCVGVRRRPELGAPAGFARGGRAWTQLDEELPRADVLVLAAPLTAETARLMTRERLERLPRGAIVVNVARGALMDEEAVADLLEAGRLRGAVLDVFQEEPLRPDEPAVAAPLGARGAARLPGVAGAVLAAIARALPRQLASLRRRPAVAQPRRQARRVLNSWSESSRPQSIGVRPTCTSRRGTCSARASTASSSR